VMRARRRRRRVVHVDEVDLESLVAGRAPDASSEQLAPAAASPTPSG
jgi:hypothetical protein